MQAQEQQFKDLIYSALTTKKNEFYHKLNKYIYIFFVKKKLE